MEVLGTVVGIEHLTRLGKEGLDMFPYPLGSITDDAEAHLLFWNHPGLFDLLEGLAELLFVLHLMPTEHMDDALAIQQREAKALRVAPFVLPPRPPRPLARLPRAAPPSAVGTRRHRGAINPEHQHRTAQAARRQLGYPLLNLVTRRRHIQDGEPLGRLIRQRVHALTAHRHPTETAKQCRSCVIRDFGHQVRRGLLHVELKSIRAQAQYLIEGGHPTATGPTIEIRPLKLHRPHHGFDGAAHGLAGLQHPITLWTENLLAIVFPTVDMRNDRLSDAPGELLAQVPHRGGHLHEG